MGRDGDVEGLGEVGDLLHLGDSTSPADIGHDVVDETLGEVGEEVPSGEFAFADAEVYVGVSSELAVGFDALGLQRFFEPCEVVGHHAIAEVGGSGDVEVSVCVDHEFDVGAEAFSERGHEVFGVCGSGGGDFAVDVASVFGSHFWREGVEFEGLISECDLCFGVGYAGVDVVGRAAVGVKRYGVSHWSA